MADFRAIMSLVFTGRSYRQIVEAVGCSHREVAAARKVIAERGVTAARLAGMSDAELVALFPDGRSGVSAGYDGPDFVRVVASMRANPHFTLLQAWRGYVGSASDLRKYGYSQYCHLFGQYAVRNDLVATLHHEPGRAMFVDWAGDTIGLIDSAGGKPSVAYLFVAVLPFSGCVYCRAFTDMRTPAWITAHIGALEHFGGVPQIVVPDHASTATHRAKRGDGARFVNDRYRQMADHYGTAIVPARVRRPRDKAAVESAVNTINKRVIGYLLEETWTSLAELNEAIGERIHEINHELRRADGSTRFERFTAEEAPMLSRLPDEAFEQVDWRSVKVGRNYHVTADHQHYSVPHALAGRMLRVRLTASRVTVFDGQQVVAEHQRKTGRKGQYSTDPGHVPEQHRHLEGLWSRRWFVDRAGAFGPDRADPRPPRDRGSGLPGLPEHPRNPGAAQQGQARSGLPATDQHGRLPDVLDDQASDGRDRQRREETGAESSSGVQPQEHPLTAGRRGRVGPWRGLLPARPVTAMFTSVDYEKFRALRITHVATRFEQLISDESNDELTPEQLFLTAVDDALDARRAARIDKLIRQAGFPIPTATIAEIDYREGRGLNATRMRRYGAHQWRTEPTNLLVTSPTGAGKTYLVCAIGIAACHNENSVLYTRMDELARKLVIARADGIAHQDFLTTLSETDLLIIDDFLTVGIDPDAASDLFAILAGREHRRPTVIASQSGPDYWAGALPDRVAADSIVNRLANNARTINLGEVDMRRHRNQNARAAPEFWE